MRPRSLSEVYIICVSGLLQRDYNSVKGLILEAALQEGSLKTLFSIPKRLRIIYPSHQLWYAYPSIDISVGVLRVYGDYAGEACHPGYFLRGDPDLQWNGSRRGKRHLNGDRGGKA